MPSEQLKFQEEGEDLPENIIQMPRRETEAPKDSSRESELAPIIEGPWTKKS
jgi:hypothetical protein